MNYLDYIKINITKLLCLIIYFLFGLNISEADVRLIQLLSPGMPLGRNFPWLNSILSGNNFDSFGYYFEGLNSLCYY